MKTFLSFLFETGVRPEMTEQAKKRVVLTNQFALGLGVLGTIGAAQALMTQGFSTFVLIYYILPLLNSPITLLLNKFGLTRTAKFLSLLAFLFVTLFPGIYVGENTTIQTLTRLALLVSVALPMTLFEVEDWPWMAAGVLLIATLMVCLEPLGILLDKGIRIPEAALKGQATITFVIQILIMVGAFWLSQRIDLKIFKDLLRRTQESEVKYRELSEQLDIKVKERTHELSLTNRQLEKTLTDLQNTQAHLVQSEKMTALGQMVAGVAHELNTPIGYASNNVSIIQTRFGTITAALRTALEAQQCVYDGALEQALAKMNQVSQAPNGTVLELTETVARTQRLFTGVTTGLEQMAELVRSMRNFARLDEAEMKKANLHDGLKGCLQMVGHLLKEKSITLETAYADMPLIDCYPAQLNQVFLNLITNAIHVVETKEDGKIKIETRMEGNHAVIRISDNGGGIPKAVQPKIFDPFFTTKPVGQGTGLGLSICYDIVKKHQGEIRFETQEGKGTTFIVEIPAQDFLVDTH
ncbi:MAG: GHKL domain-containing protein [Rhizobacter sp.]|nr:GHKL domain-containing protein [Chlorobiales bacterium]